MNPDIKKYLQDILLSIEAIEFHVRKINVFSEYEMDITVVDAVERRLGIIGEALYQINKRDKLITVNNKSKIISLRHILVHEYDLIEDVTIWNIILHHLPILKQEVESILKNLEK